VEYIVIVEKSMETSLIESGVVVTFKLIALSLAVAPICVNSPVVPSNCNAGQVPVIVTLPVSASTVAVTAPPKSADTPVANAYLPLLSFVTKMDLPSGSHYFCSRWST